MITDEMPSKFNWKGQGVEREKTKGKLKRNNNEGKTKINRFEDELR